MDRIAALVLSLQTSGLDMFEQRRYREKIASRGVEAVRELLPLIPSDPLLVEGLLLETLRRLTDEPERTSIRYELERRIAPNNEPSTRRVSIRVLAELYPEATHVGQRLLDFAADHSRETKDMRLHALKASARLQSAPMLGHGLVALLRDQDPDVVLETMGVLSVYSGIITSDDVTHELERLVGPMSPLEVRCRAIELLGRFAEIDALERIMLLPLKSEREYMAVQTMVRSLLEKPRSVVSLSPKSFEHLVRRLLEKMGYEEVLVQRKGSWDQGVDVTAWRDEERLKGRQRIKMVGQCKRYRRANLVGPEVVDKMVETLQAEKAGRGVIITTSGFTPSAIERAHQHQHIELISGAELQQLLDERLERDLYRVLE
jgi:HJR/Mrr/RecB family endonuclease